MPTVKCQTCGKEFNRKQSALDKVKNHYCSKECSANHPRVIRTKVCPCCNKEFEIKHSIQKQVYCSVECVRVSATTRKELCCEMCGNTFTVNLWRYKSGVRFCSRECQIKARKQGKIDNNRRANPAKQTCQMCGKMFDAKQAVARQGKAKYCSRKCYSESLKLIKGKDHWKYSRISKSCLNCGKQISAVKSVEVRTKFCSRECAGAYNASIHHSNTKIESAIANLLSDMSIAFESQKRITHYVCDFYVPSANLVIEADGDYWHSLPKNQIRDRRKTTYLLNCGYRLLRLPEHKINKDIKWCQRQIKKAIKEGPWQSPIW